MSISVLMFLAGMVALVGGANWLIEGASSLASRLKISPLVIGLTVVAFGTSLPEMVINLAANSTGASDLAIGNILGSNVANILLVLGISAIIHPIVIRKRTVWQEIFFGVTATAMFIVLVADHLFGAAGISELTRSDGIVLISYFAILMYYTFGPIKTSQPKPTRINTDLSLSQGLTRLIFGMTALMLGSRFTVSGATAIATGLGISQSLVGLTIVAIGTSLPELAASVTAAFKKEVDIAVGSVVGSNLFNIFWVLGVNAIISPIIFSRELFTDAIIALSAALLLFLFMLFGDKRRILQKWHGWTFVSLYFVYMVFLVFRG